KTLNAVKPVVTHPFFLSTVVSEVFLKMVFTTRIKGLRPVSETGECPSITVLSGKCPLRTTTGTA
ncbi:MAG: hypothetical protein QXS14_07225, partial [Desulfurococcaceae archaeon]